MFAHHIIILVVLIRNLWCPGGVFQVVLGHISGCPGISGGVWWCVGRGNCTQVTCNNVGEFGVILFGGKCIFQLLPEGLIPDKGIYMQCVGVCELLFHCHAEYGGNLEQQGQGRLGE